MNKWKRRKAAAQLRSIRSVAKKARLRMERGQAELAICGDNEVNSANERIQYGT